MCKVVTFGEIMLRLTTPRNERFLQTPEFRTTFGGSESNVAVLLANLNVSVSYVTRLPENDIAKACSRELQGFGVETKNILFGGDRMGVYFLEIGAVNRASKVVYDRAHSAISEIKPGIVDWENIFNGVEWYHWSGITPAISQNAADVCAEAISCAKSRGITVSVDLNFRNNLWNYGKEAYEVIPELVKECDIIIGNEEDAERSLKISSKNSSIKEGVVNRESFNMVSQKIIEEFPNCKKVITSVRKSFNANHNNWSGTLYNGKDFLVSPSYEITHIVDRLGGGDSFAAGIIYGLLNSEWDDQKVLDFGVAASALNHTIYGDYSRITLEEIENLMERNISGQVIR